MATAMGGQGATVEATTDELRVDHRLLGQLLARIELVAEAMSACELLAELREYLLGHFEAEMRQDGFFDQVLERAPWHATAVDVLRREHTTVIVEIERIHRHLSSRPPPDSAPMQDQLLSLVQTLRNHESREGALACEILQTELGDGD
jgi:hemerythrin HHE cation binding domain-containing protein